MLITTKIDFNHLDAAKSLFSSFMMASFYVLSLYLWSKKYRFNRNDPKVLFRRFISVSISCLFSLIFLFFISQYSISDELGHTLNKWIGFNFNLIDFKSLLFGFGLTLTLFLGPIVQELVNIYLNYIFIYEHSLKSYTEK